jgi:hypothetical protein
MLPALQMSNREYQIALTVSKGLERISRSGLSQKSIPGILRFLRGRRSKSASGAHLEGDYQ